MIKQLEKEFARTTTENGCGAFNTTLNSCLDLFSRIGSARKLLDSKKREMFKFAFFENPELAVKILFWIRDIRGGAGERSAFRDMCLELALLNPTILKNNLNLVPYFGRWDDLWIFLDCNSEIKNEVIKIVKQQLKEDLESDTPSLLAKWLPSANTSSEETKRLGRIMARELFNGDERKYRKTLSELRKKIKIVETLLSQKEYSKIEYNKIPSKAGMKYRNAFLRNDEERYRNFISQLSKGEVSINSSTLYPYEIVEKLISMHYDYEIDDDKIKLYDGMWKNLIDYTDGNFENVISVVDVSGSMEGTPMNVAISLGIYLAEKTKGEFKNKIITFESDPNLITIPDGNIFNKVSKVASSDWGGSTNLKAVFNLILKTAISNNITQEEMPKILYIFSDMQFDSATTHNDDTLLEAIQKQYSEKGYRIPKIVFWNLDSRDNAFPCTADEKGVQLVSGFSPSLFKQLLKKEFLSPIETMMEIINSDRYNIIKV